MLNTNYLVLDCDGLVYDADEEITLLFETEEAAKVVADAIIDEQVEEGINRGVAEMSTVILPFKYKT